MKNSALILAASAALVSAQATFNSTTGVWTCAQPNVAYCAGDSLKTDIIIRCDANGVGQPGRCSDNLVGEPPIGDFPALCYQTGNLTGDASCEKNCVVYGSSGNGAGTFTLPTASCTPTFTAFSSSSPTSTFVSSTSASTSASTSESVSTTVVTSSSVVSSTISSSAVVTSISTLPPPLSTGSGSGAGPSGNGTSGGSGATTTTLTTVTSASKTPVGPTKSTSSVSSVPTAGASSNRVGGALAVLGLAAAYLL